MMFGHHGRYLRINASTGSAEVAELSPRILRKFVGGVGLAAWLLHRECPRGVYPLAAENPLAFVFSPLVGTPLTTSAKFAVAAKSPLTDRFCDALSSSRFAIEGNKTGFDALVINGRAASPSILMIDDGVVRLESAGDLWSAKVPAATDQLRDRYGPDWAFAVIGPAGESLVRFATISHDNRHAGRGGLGAVLGAKNLKAVGVRGTHRTQLADPAGVVAAAKELSSRSFGPATAKYRELGTVASMLTFNRLNALPTRNFQAGQFEGAEAISGEMLNDAHRVARAACAACTIGCEHIYRESGDREQETGDRRQGTGVRLEYESLFALGPLCGVADRDAILSLLDQIAHRKDLGLLLADGTRRAAAAIGGESPDFAPHVKGLELPGYEPRALQAMALGFAVGTRGADHNRSGAYEADFSLDADRLNGDERTARLAIETEDRAALIDSLILCKFLRGVFADIWTESAELLAKVTGWDVTAQELRAVARRVVAVRKLFNIREGWTPAEDTLPRRFLTTALPAGTAPGATLTEERLRDMIAAYNTRRGWSAEGWVPETLADLS